MTKIGITGSMATAQIFLKVDSALHAPEVHLPNLAAPDLQQFLQDHDIGSHSGGNDGSFENNPLDLGQRIW